MVKPFLADNLAFYSTWHLCENPKLGIFAHTAPAIRERDIRPCKTVPFVEWYTLSHCLWSLLTDTRQTCQRFDDRASLPGRATRKTRPSTVNTKVMDFTTHDRNQIASTSDNTLILSPVDQVIDRDIQNN